MPALILAHASGTDLISVGSTILQLIVVAAVISGYVHGLRAIRSRAGAGRVVTAANVWCFFIGIALVEAALLGPIDALDNVLFSVQMVQHLLLGLIAPLFLVLGRPVIVISWALPAARRRAFEQFRRKLLPPSHFRRSRPWLGIAAVMLHVGSWWLWHIPNAFDVTLRNTLIHEAEHLTLFLTALFFWWVVVGVRWRERAGLAILELLVASMGTGMLSALLVFTNHPLYTVSPELASYGITAMSDQQLGGAIMWVPGGIVYLIVAVVILVRWLDLGPSRTSEPERPVPEWKPVTAVSRISSA